MKIGIKGISYSTTERKYLVRVTKNSKRIYLGRFSSLDEAKSALEAEQCAQNKPNNDQPILSALRAEFAPKKPKSTKNSAKVTTNKKQSTTPVKTMSLKNSKQPENYNNVFKNVSVSSMDKVDQRKLTLHGILRYLMEEADKRKTSVFDVVVQEIASLVK